VASTPGSSKSGQRPPHPEGNQLGEERAEPALKAGKNGKGRSGQEGTRARKGHVPDQRAHAEAEEAADQDEALAAKAAAEHQRLKGPTSKPAQRGGPLAVTYADHMNESQPGMTADDQIKLIKAREDALNRTLKTVEDGVNRTVRNLVILGVVAVVVLSGFMAVVTKVAPDVPIERLVAVAVFILLSLVVGRLIRNKWWGGGRP